MYRINRCMRPITQEVIEGFRTIAVPTIGDAQGRFGCMSYAIKPLSPAMRIAGHAVTVQTYRADNLLLHVALEMAQEGDVLVVDAAPTGETLSLLRYPERLERLFAKALPTKRAVLKVVRETLINVRAVALGWWRC